MSITYEIDRERNELRVTAWGTITFAEVSAHLLRERQDLVLPWKELIDARSAAPELSSPDVRRIVDLLRDAARTNRLGPTAVVVSTPVAYGMMRMLQILVEDTCIIHPFRVLAEAEQWLRIGSGS